MSSDRSPGRARVGPDFDTRCPPPSAVPWALERLYRALSPAVLCHLRVQALCEELVADQRDVLLLRLMAGGRRGLVPRPATAKAPPLPRRRSLPAVRAPGVTVTKPTPPGRDPAVTTPAATRPSQP